VRSSRRDFLQGVGSCGATLVAAPLSLHPLMAGADENALASRLAQDPLRAQFHLLPARNWMNDPNGPIYWDGRYHMFFQYNPGAAVWGDMHWAHAVSPDMLHWKHLPLALAPTPDGPDQQGCFSGSAVKDGGTATILYTAVKTVTAEQATLRDGTHNFLETQCLATSVDPMLKTWSKLPAPVLFPPRDPKITGFRDPCLWRDAGTWYMGIGSGQRGEGGQVLLYRSTDLRQWEYLHPLAGGKGNGKQTEDFVDSAEMWECPDFFQLGKKYVLLYSTERKVYWEVGDFDRKDLLFHPEKRGYLDSGAFYAPKSQLDATGRRILWGWIPETRPEAEFSAAGWAGCMSLPRVLSVNTENNLAMNFLPALSELRQEGISLAAKTQTHAQRDEALQKFTLTAASAECQIEFRRKKFDVSFAAGDGPWLTLSFDPSRTGQELRLGAQTASVPATENANHRLDLFLDASVLECIIDDTVALTARIYTVPKASIRVAVRDTDLDAALVSLQIWNVKPISRDRLTS
jgi:beta-fructofuranosidase